MMITPRSFLYSHPLPTPPSSPTKQQSSVVSRRRDDRFTKNNIGVSSSPVLSNAAAAAATDMAKRKDSGSLSPSRRGLPSASVTNVVRPTTPTSAVQIPVKSKQEAAYMRQSRHHADSQRWHNGRGAGHKRRPKHSPDSIPASVAELLALTSIPNRRPPRRRQSKDSRMTVDSIISQSQVSEKELSQELGLSPLSRSPMDVLLSPPEDLLDDDESVTSDSGFTSAFSTREGSFESLPSLGDSFGTSLLSPNSPATPRSRQSRQPRRSLEPVSTPPGEQPDHPLSVNSDDEMDHVGFNGFDPSPMEVEKKQPTVFMPLKTAFKSNLTASLRALRSAARSLSSFTATSVPPQDLITRSILTIDPGVPFTDERRPPVLEEQPSEAMRRYLNPTTSARLELRTNGVSTTRSYTASIQMQTYKVQRTRSAPPSANRQALLPPVNSPKSPPEFTFPPGPRQREIRENPDFIRIAVMEHLMRKRGKLDNQQEGHARWLLPPRKQSSKVYDIGPDGVPTRWISTSQDII